MNAGESPSLSMHCKAFFFGLREACAYLYRRANVRHPYERWTAVRFPDSVQSVLFVCKGNICRSPLAEAYFQSLVKKEGRQMTVRSAGLETTTGKPAHSKAKTVALEYLLSLDEHATTQVHKELVEQSDLIIVMEIAQKVRLHRLYPNSKGKVVLLGRFDSAGSIEIADPYGRPIEDFHTCFEQVRRSCDALASRLALKRGTFDEPTLGG